MNDLTGLTNKPLAKATPPAFFDNVTPLTQLPAATALASREMAFTPKGMIVIAGSGAHSVPLESERSSNLLFDRIFRARTGIHLVEKCSIARNSRKSGSAMPPAASWFDETPLRQQIRPCPEWTAFDRSDQGLLQARPKRRGKLSAASQQKTCLATKHLPWLFRWCIIFAKTGKATFHNDA